MSKDLDIDWEDLLPARSDEGKDEIFRVGSKYKTKEITREDAEVDLIEALKAVGAKQLVGEVEKLEKLEEDNKTRFVVAMAAVGVSKKRIADMLGLPYQDFNTRFNHIVENVKDLRNAVINNKIYNLALSGDKKFLELWGKAHCGLGAGAKKEVAAGGSGPTIVAGGSPTINIQVVKKDDK